MKYIITLKNDINDNEFSFIYDNVYDALSFIRETATHCEVNTVIEIRTIQIKKRIKDEEE